MTTPQSQTINAAGYSFAVRLTRLPTRSLKLDPLNPRIRYLADTKGVSPKTNKEICELLFQDEDIFKLRQDIKRDKGLHDAILVNADGKIIEGNSRAACYITLLDQDSTSGTWDNILAMVLEEQMNPADVAMLQGYYHVRMKNKWETFAKAAHVYRLEQEHKKSIEQIRQATGLQEKTIRNMIQTYQTMKKHSFDAEDVVVPESTVRTFSHFFEFEKSTDKDVAKFRETPNGRKTFTKWVRENKFDRGEDVRKLGPILRNRTALDAFKKGGIKQAKPVVVKSDPTTDLSQYRAIEKLTTTLKTRFVKEVELLRENAACRSMLEDLHGIIGRLITAAKK